MKGTSPWASSWPSGNRPFRLLGGRPSRRQPCLASAGDDGTVRIWYPAASACLLTIPLHYSAAAVAWIGEALAVGLSGGVLVIDIYSAAPVT